MATQRVRTDGSALPHKTIAFLIEGFTSCRDTTRFPEISAAIKLAEANSCGYFDTISSYDVEQITTLLKNKPEKDQKAILLSIYLSFASEANPADIINQLLKEPFKNMLAVGVIKEIPKWVDELSPFTIESFTRKVLEESFGNKVDEFKAFKKEFQKEVSRTSDEISSKKFVDYLNRFPNIKTIYCLVGKNHLDMLGSIGITNIKEENYRIVKIQASGRSIEVHLYGGFHGEMAHYEMLAKHAEQRGLIVPALLRNEENETDKLLKILLAALSGSGATRRIDMFEESRSRNAERKLEVKEKEIWPVSKSAERFDEWMKKYTRPSRTDNANLIVWLFADEGAKHVEDYKQFCELAIALKAKGYSTVPPPNESEFKEGVSKHSEQSAGRRFGY